MPYKKSTVKPVNRISVSVEQLQATQSRGWEPVHARKAVGPTTFWQRSMSELQLWRFYCPMECKGLIIV